jgi:tubby-related protein 1
MGECPRYFKLEILQKGEVHRMANLKPEWNDNLECYCLNFYGRVKKASAKNFQIIYPDDPDNIIFQHGKVSKDEFNLDFREPFNYVYAFAVSLAAIGKKRVVS